MTEPLNHYVVDPNDPIVQARATVLLTGLLEAFDVQVTISVLFIALENVLSGILHTEAPDPERNIRSIAALLDTLVREVMDHADCARAINGKDVKATRH